MCEKAQSRPGAGGEAVILVENIRSYYDILQPPRVGLPAPHGGPNAMMGIARPSPARRAIPGLKPGR